MTTNSAINFSSPGSPASQGQRTAGHVAHYPSPLNPAHPDQQWLRVEQALNGIQATAIERRVIALVYRQHGPASARRVIAAFREQHPIERQLTLLPEGRS